MPRLPGEAMLARRQHLISAAWECMGGTAYQDLTVDQVCRQAGVSKGSFYVHFPSKQSLLLAMIDDDANRLEGQLDSLADQGLGPLQRLHHFARVMLERADDPALVQITADIWTAVSTDAEVREHFAAAVARRRALLREWIGAGVERGEMAALPENALASILLSLSDGLLLHRALDPTAFKWENIGIALDALLRGVALG